MTAQVVTPQPASPRKPQNTKRFVILMAVSMVIGAGAGYPIGRMLKGMPHSQPSLWTIPAICVMALLALALHELGHVAGGLVCGFKFHLFVAGPVRIQRHGERIRISWNRIASLWGGVAACTPQSFGPELAKQMLLFTAGGPLFSLLGALALWPAFVLRVDYPTLAGCLLVLGLISAMLCLATLMPLRMGGYVSDGGRLIMLLRGKEESRRWIGLASLAGLSLAERPRNWPPQLFEMVGQGTDGSPDASFCYLLRHMWEADRHEWAAAQESLEKCLAGIECVAPPMRTGIYAAAAYFHARRLRDAAAAREYLVKAEGPGLHQKSDLHIVRAAVRVAEGRMAEASTELDLAAAALKQKPALIAEPMWEDIGEMRAEIA